MRTQGYQGFTQVFNHIPIVYPYYQGKQNPEYVAALGELTMPLGTHKIHK